VRSKLTRVVIPVLLTVFFTTIGIMVYFENFRDISPLSVQSAPDLQVKGLDVESEIILPTLQPSVSVKAPISRSIYIGFWTQGFFDFKSNTLHPEALTSLELKIGKKAAIAHYYRGWEWLDSSILLSEFETISSYGWRPMISVNPYFFEKCNANGKSLYASIAVGNCDEFLKNAGRNLSQYKKPFFLRFAWEMNIESMEWSIQKTGSTSSDFILAWRRMHDFFEKEGVKNVLWVFAPDVGNTEYGNIYPGDNYVDWVGLDGYNWGTTQSWSRWQSFNEVFSNAYSAITLAAPNKPLMISEINSTDQGGSKVSWYTDALQTQISRNFPKISAVVFYNEDRSARENVNWLIDTSIESLKAFKDGTSNPIYKSSI